MNVAHHSESSEYPLPPEAHDGNTRCPDTWEKYGLLTFERAAELLGLRGRSAVQCWVEKGSLQVVDGVRVKGRGYRHETTLILRESIDALLSCFDKPEAWMPITKAAPLLALKPRSLQGLYKLVKGDEPLLDSRPLPPGSGPGTDVKIVDVMQEHRHRIQRPTVEDVEGCGKLISVEHAQYALGLPETSLRSAMKAGGLPIIKKGVWVHSRDTFIPRECSFVSRRSLRALGWRPEGESHWRGELEDCADEQEKAHQLLAFKKVAQWLNVHPSELHSLMHDYPMPIQRHPQKPGVFVSFDDALELKNQHSSREGDLIDEMMAKERQTSYKKPRLSPPAGLAESLPQLPISGFRGLEKQKRDFQKAQVASIQIAEAVFDETVKFSLVNDEQQSENRDKIHALKDWLRYQMPVATLTQRYHQNGVLRRDPLIDEHLEFALQEVVKKALPLAAHDERLLMHLAVTTSLFTGGKYLEGGKAALERASREAPLLPWQITQTLKCIHTLQHSDEGDADLKDQAFNYLQAQWQAWQSAMK